MTWFSGGWVSVIKINKSISLASLLCRPTLLDVTSKQAANDVYTDIMYVGVRTKAPLTGASANRCPLARTNALPDKRRPSPRLTGSFTHLRTDISVKLL